MENGIKCEVLACALSGFCNFLSRKGYVKTFDRTAMAGQKYRQLATIDVSTENRETTMKLFSELGVT